MLILHIYLDINCSLPCISAALNDNFHNNFTNTVLIYPRFYPAQQRDVFENSWFLFLQEIDVVQLFVVKQFKVISLRAI